MKLIDEARAELTGDILPFWMNRMTDPRGGFYGEMDAQGNIVPDAPKGLILNARILWTFSSAYRILKQREYLEAAVRAKDYIIKNFIDTEFGGAYWSIDAEGRPLDTKKQFYAIAFAIYGLAEFSRATGDKQTLDQAVKLFECIEAHSFDAELDGYIEACTRDWQPIEDMRLSDKDQNDAKTMNTHLHILEAYTALYRVWKNSRLEEQLRNIIILFMNRIAGPDGHLRLFFDEHWCQNGDIQSFGHDIECSWLLWEACNVLGDKALTERARPLCTRIAEAGMEGYIPGEGMMYEWNIGEGEKHLNRDWWVQAETVVGCYNQWQMTGDGKWLDAADDSWDFIKREIIAPDGEWYWGAGNRSDCRAGFWKCPYHNGRMCMELIERQ